MSGFDLLRSQEKPLLHVYIYGNCQQCIQFLKVVANASDKSQFSFVDVLNSKVNHKWWTTMLKTEERVARKPGKKKTGSNQQAGGWNKRPYCWFGKRILGEEIVWSVIRSWMRSCDWRYDESERRRERGKMKEFRRAAVLSVTKYFQRNIREPSCQKIFCTSYIAEREHKIRNNREIVIIELIIIK